MGKEARLEVEVNGQKQLFVFKRLSRGEMRQVRKSCTNFVLPEREGQKPKMEFDLNLFMDLLAVHCIVEPAGWRCDLSRLDALDDDVAQKIVDCANNLNTVSPLGSGSLELPSVVGEPVGTLEK